LILRDIFVLLDKKIVTNCKTTSQILHGNTGVKNLPKMKLVLALHSFLQSIVRNENSFTKVHCRRGI